MKFYQKALLAFILCSSSVSAATVGVRNGSAPGNPFKTSTDQFLATPGIYIGYVVGFNSADSQLMSVLTGGNLAQVMNVFVPFGTPFSRDGATYTIGTGAVSYNTSTGATSGTLEVSRAAGTANSFQSTGVAGGTRLFVLALDTNSYSSTAANFALVSATEWALMPTDDLANVGNLLLTAVNTAYSAANPANTELFYGRSGSIQLLANVPEPTAALLSLLAGLAGLRRRR
jgi:hypothetical protein